MASTFITKDVYKRQLFDYIQSHYQPDEYIVSLFSDHGVTAIDNEEFILKPNHTQSCFMLRGAGVPARGIVKDEVTSAMDLYPSICHLAGLPVDESKICLLYTSFWQRLGPRPAPCPPPS